MGEWCVDANVRSAKHISKNRSTQAEEKAELPPQIKSQTDSKTINGEFEKMCC